MLNNVILVGRISSLPTAEEVGIVTKFTLATSRSYKNTEGLYETDFIPIVVGGENMAKSLTDYCKVGDMVGVKGRIETTPLNEIKIIADRLTFLSSKKDD